MDEEASLLQPSREVVAQRTIACFDQEVLLVLTQARTCYVSLPNSCDALGLNTRGQFQRIQRTVALRDGLRQLAVQTRGGDQRVNCLQIEFISGWLASIHGPMRTTLGGRIDTYYTIITEAAQHFLDNPEEMVLAPAQGEKGDISVSSAIRPHASQQELFQLDADADLRERRSLLVKLPGISNTDVLVTTSFAEDRAIREASLAGEHDWQEDPLSQRMRYIASNRLHVYLGDPDSPLSLTDTIEAIRAFGESTVLTARIILGLWNIKRSDDHLAKDGSAAIRIDDILEWRGVQKHSKVARPGALKRSTDGYQSRHKQQVHQDIKLLELCHLRGLHRVKMQGGRIRQIRIDGPYLRVTSVSATDNNDTADKSREDLIGYFIAPGSWINTYEEHGNYFLVEIDRRIFQLHPQKDQIALRIALFLTEHWRQHFKTGRYAEPITMQELLTASMVPIDHNHLTTRFAPRVQAALTRLIKQGIIGAAQPLTTVDTAQAHWGKEWLQTRWSIVPPASMAQRSLKQTIQQHSLLPSEDLTKQQE